MLFNNLYQTGNPMSGGWRYPYGGATSTDALNYTPMDIDPEFLKQVARSSSEDKKGLLEEIVSPKPLAGLLSGDTGYSPGDAPGSSGNSSAADAGGAPMAMTSPGSLGVGFDGKKGAMGFMSAGLPGLLAGLTMAPQAPVFEVMMPGLNGYGIADTNYGASPNTMGAPTQAQANALAEALASHLSAYGDSSDGGATLGAGGFGGDLGSALGIGAMGNGDLGFGVGDGFGSGGGFGGDLGLW